MRRWFALALVAASLLLHAEEGEWQFHLGGGGYFPFTMKTEDRTIVVLASWNVTTVSFFGISDNLDIGLQYAVTHFADVYTKRTYDTIEGKEYFDYLGNKLQMLLRYNLYPGYDLSPHLVVGGGMLIETYRNRAFYNKNDLIVSDFDGSDYARVQPCVSGGIDLQYRVWEWLILSFQTLFSWSPDTMHLETNFFFGARWFMKSYYF